MYWINQLREKGYASNQVDYICHSMGGSILRNAVEQNKSFYRNANYNKGFVHKFITLNTPHQGSSFANFLTDLDNDPLGLNWILQGELGKNGLFDCAEMKCNVKDAILDLRYVGGVKFNKCILPSHMIGGSVSCSNYPEKTIDLLHNVSLLTNKINTKNLCTSLDDYFTKNGFEPNFVEENDGIVSKESQFSGNPINSLPLNCSFFSGLMHNSEFGESPTKSEDVFNKVEELLNSDVESSLFGYLPSTVETKSANISPSSTINLIENKISILYPSNKLSYNAGDTMMIKLNVDTVGLKSFALFFQNQAIYDMPSSPSVSIALTVNPEQIEGQSIVAIGNYQITGQSSISTVSKNIKVNPVGTITEFNIKPEVIVLQKGKSTRPDYEAVFPNAIANIGVTDLLTVTIKDPTLLSYNSATNSFTGLAAGTTNATINYRGKSKTIFFEILQAVTPPYDFPTGLYNLDKTSKQPRIKLYPNPVSNELTIEYSGYAPFDITNAQGQIVYNGEIIDKTVVSTSNFAPGIYLIRIYTDKITEAQKFIKE
jgi:hypothetical protein